jgi:WD40 repeat protein
VFVNDRYVITGSSDATIKKWDLASCRCMFTFKGHTSKIHK